MGFPTTSTLDTFNRADENPLTSSTWSAITYGTFVNLKIVSNVAKQSTAAGNDGLMYWNVSNTAADCEVFVTVAAISGTDNFVLLGLRYTSSGNGYKIDWDKPTSRVRVWRDDLGVRTQLGANITQAMSVGDAIGISMIGSTITVYYKASAGAWVNIGTRTDSTYTAGGRLQLGQWLSADVASTLDSFGGGDAIPSGIMTTNTGYWGQ